MDVRLQRFGGIAALAGLGPLAFQLLLFSVYLPHVGFSINDLNGDLPTRLRLLNAARNAFLWDGVVLFAFFSFQLVTVYAVYVRIRDSSPVLSHLGAVFGYASIFLLLLEQVRIYFVATTFGISISADQMAYLSPMFDALRGLLENGSTFMQIPWFLLLSLASLRNRELTRPVAYLGIAAAVWDALIVVRLLPGNPSTGSPLGLVLLVAVGVVLLVRPDPSHARKASVA